MKIDKANVFGEEYKIEFFEHPDEDLFYAHADGRTNFDEKKIVVWDNKKETERTLVHELVHAHLYESGATVKAFDEDFVEYLTTLFMRIEKIMKEAECSHTQRNLETQ